MELDRKLLIRRRFELGLRQVDLARAVGISKGHMHDLENGRVNPSPPLLVKLADALAVEPGELIVAVA